MPYFRRYAKNTLVFDLKDRSVLHKNLACTPLPRARVISPHLPEDEAELFLRRGENILVLEVGRRSTGAQEYESVLPTFPLCRTSTMAGWPAWRGAPTRWDCSLPSVC